MLNKEDLQENKTHMNIQKQTEIEPSGEIQFCAWILSFV